MDLQVGLNIVLNPEQTRHKAQMLYKGTNAATSTVSVSRERSGPQQGAHQLQRAKRFSDEKVGMWSGIMKGGLHTRHLAKCFTLEVDCAPNDQWKHNLTKQQQYLLKNSDHRSVFSYCPGGKTDFYIVMKQTKL